MSDDEGAVLDYFNRSPYRDLLDIEVTEAADGRAAGRLRFGEKHSSNRRQAIAQGGVAFSLADSVAGAAATSLVGFPTPTIDFRIDYLAPATGDLVATAEVVREGGETAVVDAEVVQPAGDAEGYINDPRTGPTPTTGTSPSAGASTRRATSRTTRRGTSIRGSDELLSARASEWPTGHEERVRGTRRP